MSKAILIIDMPEHCYECPLENTKRCPFLWEDVESLDKPKDCPLKPYKEAIPIEWLKENYGNLQIVRYIIKDWEIENDIYNDTKAMDPEIHG